MIVIRTPFQIRVSVIIELIDIDDRSARTTSSVALWSAIFILLRS